MISSLLVVVASCQREEEVRRVTWDRDGAMSALLTLYAGIVVRYVTAKNVLMSAPPSPSPSSTPNRLDLPALTSGSYDRFDNRNNDSSLPHSTYFV
jgi:hypothetical protein